MYNRYIPQPDGSYRRSTQLDQQTKSVQMQNQHRQNKKERESPPVCDNGNHRQNQVHMTKCAPSPLPPKPEQCREEDRNKSDSIGSFLRRLLPGEFDTGDLLIVLLILLMAGDCLEEKNTALLTLVLYLFL